MRFEKYEGLGNDFVIVEATRDDAITSARAVEICDRRRGVGADGVLVVLPSRDPASPRKRWSSAELLLLREMSFFTDHRKTLVRRSVRFFL